MSSPAHRRPYLEGDGRVYGGQLRHPRTGDLAPQGTVDLRSSRRQGLPLNEPWANVKLNAIELAADEEGRKPGGSWRVVPLIKPRRAMVRRAWSAQGRPKRGKVCPPRHRSRSGMLQLAGVRKQARERWQEHDIAFRKRIDRASPLIAQALAQNQVVDADFRFFRAGVDGDVKEFFRVATTQGRVVSFRQLLDDALDPAHATRPPLEEVGLTFRRISWADLDHGVTFQDDLSVK